MRLFLMKMLLGNILKEWYMSFTMTHEYFHFVILMITFYCGRIMLTAIVVFALVLIMKV